MSNLRFALVGNQNCGKTTLFNALTGSNQHVGNFPGVTVQMKEGNLRKHKDVTVMDLPGVYSLSPYSAEEIVTRDILLKDRPDAIINVVDVTSIERSLYLTLQCIELNIPMILALNMMDELTKNGGTIDILALEQSLTIPVVPISAIEGSGVRELVHRALAIAQARQKPARLDFCSPGPVHMAIHAVAHLIEEKVNNTGLPLRFSATKLIEGDTLDGLVLSENEQDIIGHFIHEMETALGTDKNAALADMRYSYIDKLCKETVRKPLHTEAQLRSVKLDEILTHKFLALPIFLLIMMTIFWLTFDVIGGSLSSLFEGILQVFVDLFDKCLSNLGINQAMHSMLIDGVCAGITSVLSFLPTILTLFLFLSILEDSGYMARVAFVMDKLLRKIGLSGSSFMPMLVGFGCTVPAIMATRTLASERDRKMTIFITPFMSCSAKLPVYSVFIAALFPQHSGLIMTSLYLLGILLAVISSIILKHTLFQGKPVPFFMELPAYRIPKLRNILLQIWSKAKDFLYKAFTIIFLASLLIWFLQNFNLQFYMVDNPTDSILANIGHWLAPVFAPLGFGNWQSATALITGWTAKEVVISTLSVLTNTGPGDVPDIPTLFGELRAAYAFLVFCLLYPPCFAALATIKRELNSTAAMLGVMCFQFAVAWLTAFIIYTLWGIVSL